MAFYTSGFDPETATELENEGELAIVSAVEITGGVRLEVEWLD